MKNVTSRPEQTKLAPSHPAEKESLCKNSFTIAHPVVHLSIGDELKMTDSDDCESSYVFDQKAVKEESGQEKEDSDSDENSIDPSVQYTNINDLIDIVKNELDDDSTSTQGPKKPEIVPQRNLEDITKSIEIKFNNSTDKIKQWKNDTEIDVRQNPIAGSTYIVLTNENIDEDKSTFTESISTSDRNDI